MVTLARILHEGGRTMLWIYRDFNHIIKNQSLIVRLQFIRVVLRTTWRRIRPVFLTRGRDDHEEIWIHKGFCEGVE